MSEQLCRPIAAKIHAQQLAVDEAFARYRAANDTLTRLRDDLLGVMIRNRVGRFTAGESEHSIIGKTLMIRRVHGSQG